MLSNASSHVGDKASPKLSSSSCPIAAPSKDPTAAACSTPPSDLPTPSPAAGEPSGIVPSKPCCARRWAELSVGRSGGGRGGGGRSLVESGAAASGSIAGAAVSSGVSRPFPKFPPCT